MLRDVVSEYIEEDVLDKKHGVYLVRKKGTDELFVKKILMVYDLSVFEYLRDHPVKNTPRIIEMEQDGDFLIIIEEYIKGDSLKDILETRGTLTEEDTLIIARQICGILQELHSSDNPIIHRDIKPSNIIITPENDVILLDMDAAKHQHSDAVKDTRLLGTEGYAAPEQYGFGSSGVATDIYALGVLMNVMMTGSFPAEKKVPGRLGNIIAICTRLEPGRRYKSASELLSELKYKPEKPRINSRSVLRKYLPPGFRKGSAPLMIIAGILYILWTFLCFNAFANLGTVEKWGNRIFQYAAVIAIILFSGNYMGILDRIGLGKIKRRWIRVAAVIIADFIIFNVFLIIMTLIVNALK